MIYMLDSAYAPSLNGAQQAAMSGVKLWAGYIAGGRVYHAWSRADFDLIRQAGLRPVFVHVGTDGREAVANAWQCGAMTGDIVALDVEAGWNDTYSQAWCAAVKAAGFTTWLYGLDSEVNAHGAPFDGVWAARYVYPTVPTPTSRESIQYWNSHTEFGTGVDRSVCDDHWAASPVEEVMDYNLVVKSWYLFAFHRNPAQSEVDYWVGKLKGGENGEQVLDEFFSSAEGQAFLHLAAPVAYDDSALVARVAALEAVLAKVKGDL